MTANAAASLNILRRKGFEAKVGLGRTAIYDRLNPKSPYYDPSFPKPIKLGNGENSPVGWLEHEVDDWIAAQAVKSRSQYQQTGAAA